MNLSPYVLVCVVAGCGGSSSSGVVADPVDVPPTVVHPPGPDETAADGLLASVRSGAIVLAGALTDAMPRAVSAALEGHRFVRAGMTYDCRGTRPELRVSVHTEREIDRSELETDDTGTLYDEQSVTVFLPTAEELGAAQASAIAQACGASDVFDQTPLIMAGQLIDDGRERLELVVQPSDEILEWAVRHGHAVHSGVTGDGSLPPPGRAFRVRVYDARPDGTVIVCDREVE